MPSDRIRTNTGLTRRAFVLAAPALLLPGAALGALSGTPKANEGPFYPVRLPTDSDADLVRVDGAVRRAGGDILHLAGRVLDANGRPIAGARVEIWQCDAKGVYMHPGDGRVGCPEPGRWHPPDGRGASPHRRHHLGGSGARASLRGLHGVIAQSGRGPAWVV